MCYSNCKHEDWEGECRRGKRLIDDECHCFDGFKCDICAELKNEDDASETEGICKECFEEEI